MTHKARMSRDSGRLAELALGTVRAVDDDLDRLALEAAGDVRLPACGGVCDHVAFQAADSVAGLLEECEPRFREHAAPLGRGTVPRVSNPRASRNVNTSSTTSCGCPQKITSVHRRKACASRGRGSPDPDE